jgi:predicted DNA-binding protein
VPRRHDTTERPADRIQLRLELSPEIRDRLKVRAAQAGLSMASYLRELVERDLDQPTANASKPKGR